jgi:hypothetical protein
MRRKQFPVTPFIDGIYKIEFATLIRLFGDFDLAEDADRLKAELQTRLSRYRQNCRFAQPRRLRYFARGETGRRPTYEEQR